MFPNTLYRLSYNNIFSFYYQLSPVGTSLKIKMIFFQKSFIFYHRITAQGTRKNNFLSKIRDFLKNLVFWKKIRWKRPKIPKIDGFQKILFFSFISKSWPKVHEKNLFFKKIIFFQKNFFLSTRKIKIPRNTKKIKIFF